MKKRDIIEFEIGKMEFGGVSISQYGDRRIKMLEDWTKRLRDFLC